MNRQINPRAAVTVTFLLLVFAVELLRLHNVRGPADWSGWRALISKSATVNPEDEIYAMFDAARAGNTQAYLDCFSGPLHDQLAATAREDSAAKFKAYLMGQNSAVQGMAVTITDRLSPDEARLRVEYVYTDHNEIQNVHLKKQGTRWKIINMDVVQPVQPVLPYGTKATD